MKKYSIQFLLTIILIFFSSLYFSCNNSPTDPPVDEPIANAGTNQTISVGTYFILDGTKSTFANETERHYKWTEDASNPEKNLFVKDSLNYLFVGTPGVYKYSLVVNNGSRDSSPSVITITVNQRNEFTFKDALLQAFVRFVLKKQSGPLAQQDLESITIIQMGAALGSSYKVKDLGGVEKCANLVALLLPNQSFSDLTSLSNLTKLKKIDIHGNSKLTNINALSNLKNLEYLEISLTNISSISPLSAITGLQYLDIILTKVTDISAVTNFKNLREFYAGGLDLKALSLFNNFTNLEILLLLDCNISDIDALKNIKTLKAIELGHNSITDISALSSLTNLHTLRVGYNKITDITPIRDLKLLIDVQLQSNIISDIKTLVDNTGLGQGCSINLSGNPLNNQSINTYIPQLVGRGVQVYF